MYMNSTPDNTFFLIVLGLFIVVIFICSVIRGDFREYGEYWGKVCSNIFGDSKSKVDRLDSILRMIQAEFKPEPITNEEDLEKQLMVFLKAKGVDAKRQYSLDGIHRVDILLEGEYGLELKIVRELDELQRLVGQMEMYGMLLKDCAAVVVIPLEQREKLERYIRMFKEKRGLKIAVVEAKIKK